MDDLVPRSGDALLIVDVQNDFLPGGSLAVPHGNEVIPALNRYIGLFQRSHLPIIASRDWHPDDHSSFQAQGGPWPPHCVQDTPGAEVASDLNVPDNTILVSKAETPGQDAYSAFEGTDLDGRLKAIGVSRLFVGGLATDYCVLNTVKDAVKNKYEVVLLEDAMRPVNVQPDDGERALSEMHQLGCRSGTVDALCLGIGSSGPLLNDLYQLTMVKAYHQHKINEKAVFEFYVRQMPPGRNFLMFAGLEQVLTFLETLRFSRKELEWMKQSGRFPEGFVDWLGELRFTGDVEAMPEGTVFFPDEPVLRVTAPIAEAQLVETRIINLLQYQILVASKAARCVLAAGGKKLIDFGLRRSHGAEAGVLAARAAYLAGFDGTATVMADVLFDIPLFGTMAHSYILAHEYEEDAFLNYCRAWPENNTLLLDTYDADQAVGTVIKIAKTLKREGIAIKGVRLDSGDLGAQSRNIRQKLDAKGWESIAIFASGNLDENTVRQLIAEGAPIDGFGIGTRLAVSEDAPYLECAYKLQEHDGQARRKRSEGKATWPGSKQVYRHWDHHNTMTGDTLALMEDTVDGDPLLKPVMWGGRRLESPLSLSTIRQNAAYNLQAMPEALRRLDPTEPYPVTITGSIRELAEMLDSTQDQVKVGFNGTVFRMIKNYFKKAF